MTVHDMVRARYEAEYDREKDRLLFEYIDHWLFNNRFLIIPEDAMYDAIKTSVGMKMYLESGQIPQIDD